MAEKAPLSVQKGLKTVKQQSAHSGMEAPSASTQGELRDRLSFTPLDTNDDRVVQPFPRSPKLQGKLAKAGQHSQEQLSRRMVELQAECSKTEAHIQSLKKRRANLAKSTEVMKQQVRERFDGMRAILKQDEQAVLDALELDLRHTRTRLDQVLKDWNHHFDQVSKSISYIQGALRKNPEDLEGEMEGLSEDLSSKKPEASEEEIRLNEERFERLLRTLSSISMSLRAQLRRKTLLLDWSTVVIDMKTCHSQIMVTSEGRGLSFSGFAGTDPLHPLQFDKVCCALGLFPITAGQRYWEVDVGCCSAWAVGVAYGSLERKGCDKGTKLGRNRNSWCVELQNGHLSAWHNDRNVACQGVGRTVLAKVGVWVNYDKGQLIFYDAESMVVLQRFSAAVTTVFDRAHHQFTEPLYPAVRFLRPPENTIWPNHLKLSHLDTP
ncbi:putative E3 ubiquitin-protein ligase TRIML1 isoform 1-T1 [Aulostomus maculatus]